MDAPEQSPVLRPYKAVAAMSLNRVIGCGNRIPWHLPEDFKWFKRLTTGKVIVMGRKTFESIGKPLPDRINVVLSRKGRPIDGALTISDLSRLESQFPELASREIFICGGAQVYAQALSRCSDLYLSLVKRRVEGDAFFPEFENQFRLVEVVADYPEFTIQHYRSIG